MVSGVASDATSASRLRPSGFPVSARSRRSASVNRRRRGPRRARSTRFSSAKTRSLALSASEPAGDQQNQELKRRGGRHDRRTLPTQPPQRTQFGRKPCGSSLGQYGYRRRGVPGCCNANASACACDGPEVKDHIVPARHVAAECLDAAYIALAGIATSPTHPSWQNPPGQGGKQALDHGTAMSHAEALTPVTWERDPSPTSLGAPVTRSGL